jgi:Ser/Thr protein kinase RdoA (MazF antagonist)
MDTDVLQKRIHYSSDFEKIVQSVTNEYKLGNLINFSPILQGYEDVNIKLVTSKGSYLVKIMAASRSDEESQQYANIMQKAVDSGLAHPKLYTSSQGVLFSTTVEKTLLRLVVMDFIEGKDFFNLNEKPTAEEAIFLVNQAAKINLLPLKPQFVYDSWAIPNILTEYEKIKDKLDKDDLHYIEPLIKIFPSLHIEKLPQCFVHGDIIATNVIRSTDSRLYIIDFAVSNVYPRIQELAMLLCDLLFVKDKEKYLHNYNLALKTYQEITKLTKQEIELLPVYVRFAHAMHIIPATKEELNGNTLPENEFWLQSGKEGIRFVSTL